MGFLKRNIEIEDYLDKEDVMWEFLSDRTYQQIFSSWKMIYEAKVNEKIYEERGDFTETLNSKSPFEGYLFNAPNYKFLYDKFRTLHSRPTFGYKINCNGIKRHFVLQKNLSVICDIDFNFTFAFHAELPDLYCDFNAT